MIVVSQDNHPKAVRNAVVTLDAVQERIGDPDAVQILDDARAVLHQYQAELEGGDGE